MQWIGLGVLLGSGLLLAWTSVVAATIWVLTRPPRRTYAWAIARGLPGEPSEIGAGSSPSLTFESWTKKSAQGHKGHLAVWSVPGEARDGPTIVLTHGWGDSRVVMLGRAGMLRPMASRIVLWDMPGHGDSDGHCSLGAHEPLEFIELLNEVGDRSDSLSGESRLLLYGFSLGAGVSMVAAAELAERSSRREDSNRRGSARVIGVIAESPYRVPITPARNVLELRGLPHRATLGAALAWIGLTRAGTFTWGKASGDAGGFDRAKWAERLRRAGVPVLVLHGDLDDISPIADGRDVANAARGELVEVEGGGHTTLWSDQRTTAQCQKAVERFLASLSRTDAEAAFNGSDHA